MKRKFFKKTLAVVLAMSMVLANGITVFSAETSSTTKSEIDITGGLGSDNSGNESVTGNFDVTYTFHNATHDTGSQWLNFAVEVFGEGFGITARADAFAVGYGGAESVLGGWNNNPMAPTTVWAGQPILTEEWNVFSQDMADADVTVNVKRIDNVLVFVYDIKALTGNNYYITGFTPQVTMPDTLSIHLTGDNVKLTNIVFTVNEKHPSSIIAKEDMNISGGIGSAKTKEDVVFGDFDVTYTFHNETQGTDNWHNFVVEAFGTGFGITARADAYVVGYNGAESVLGGWGNNPMAPTTVWTGLPEADDWVVWNSDMKNADVTVNIKRVGNVLTLTYDITANEHSYHMVGVTPEVTTMPYGLFLHLTGEKVNLSSISYKINSTSVVKTVAGQIRSNSDGTKDLGIVTTIAKTDFEKDGVTVSKMGLRVQKANNQVQDIPTNFVLKGTALENPTEGAKLTLTDDTYFFRTILTGVEKAGDETIMVTPYIEYSDGTKEDGKPVTIKAATAVQA